MQRTGLGRIALIAGLSLTGSIPLRGAAALTNWSYRLPLTFEEPVGATLTNFPALIMLSDDLPGFAYAQFSDTENGADLRFGDVDLEIELPYEIEHWDTNGTSYIWVRIPALAGTNETIYALWGNPVAGTPDYRTNGVVWNADYVGVWHLNEGAEGRHTSTYSYRDSTAGGHHGADWVRAAPGNGKIHQAADLDATLLNNYGDHIRIPHHGNFSFTTGAADLPFTLSGWVYSDGAAIRMVNKANNTSTAEWRTTVNGDGDVTLSLCSGGRTATDYRLDGRAYGVAPINEWAYIAAAYDGSATTDGIRLYVNGAAVTLETPGTFKGALYSAMESFSASTIDIGATLRDDATWRNFTDGLIDAVRVAAVERSPEWVWADYMTVASNDVFMTYGVVQTPDPGLAVMSQTPDPVRDTNATARGVMLDAGDTTDADVYVCWDTTDRLTVSTGDWATVAFVGAYQSFENFSAVLSPLSPSSSYVYRFFATNSAGESAWSEAQPFDTVDVPAVSASPATGVGRRVATLHGAVTDDGGETPLAGFEWWEVDGAVTTVVHKSFQDGVFSETLEGLTESTEYAYRAWASNAAGQVWSQATHSWTTLSADPLAFYVTPSGAGARDGSSWDHAFGGNDLQPAIDQATTAGDAMLLRHGVYTNSVQRVAANQPGLTIRGGYEGVGSPGGFSAESTVLTRDPAILMRIVYGVDSVLTLDRLTISGGYANASDGPQNGIGLAFENCTTVITNSVIRDHLRDGYLLNCHGGGLYANNGSLTIVDSFIDNNQVGPGASRLHGGGMYANNVNLTLVRTHITRNRIGGNSEHYGGGIHLNGGNALIDDCWFGTNYVAQLPSGWTYHNRGGAIYANNVSPFTITNTHFFGNYVAGSATTGDNFGGALDIRGSTALTIADCVFTGNRLVAGATRAGGVMHLSGVAGKIADTFIAGAGTTTGAPELLFVATTGANQLTISNTVVHGRLGAGIRKQGTGSIALHNCLIFNANDHGLDVGAGMAEVCHTTLADNAGWGIHHAGGTLTVRDTIAWGNIDGGISTPDGTMTYTLSQEAHGGTANQTNPPLFIAGYYLSRAGLPGQPQTSPAVGAGSTTAGAAGLAERTTRTDGANPDVFDTVDLGYHDAAGFDGDLEAALNIYVDGVDGDDVNSGTDWENAVGTISEALSRTISGSTIHIATGVYSTVSGEIFPLETRYPGLTMIGRGPELTVLDAESTDRVFRATGGGAIWLEGLSFKNGYVAASPFAGAGLYLPSCQTVITNCWITHHRILASANRNGQGIVAYAGSLTIVDSRIANNGNPSSSGAIPQGGGLYAFDAHVQLIRVDVVSNIHRPNAPSRGVGVYLNGGSAWIAESLFENNRMTMGHRHEGGGLYATGVSPLTISNCTFRGNYLAGTSANQKEGAGFWVQNSAEFLLVDSDFEGNYVNGGDPRRGSALHIGSTVNGLVSDCTIIGGNAGNGWNQVWINVGSPRTLAVHNLHVQPGLVTTGDGIAMVGSGALALTNVLVHGFAGDGIRMDNADGTLDLVNATLADNGGWGLRTINGTVAIINSIAWDNTAGGFDGDQTITYSSSREAHTGAGNIQGDPRFEPAAGDYRLTRSSECVDAGNNAPWSGMPDARDLDGTPRIRNGRLDRPGWVDMGAYELAAPAGTTFLIR